jgi:hypothetical protein
MEEGRRGNERPGADAGADLSSASNRRSGLTKQ